MFQADVRRVSLQQENALVSQNGTKILAITPIAENLRGESQIKHFTPKQTFSFDDVSKPKFLCRSVEFLDDLMPDFPDGSITIQFIHFVQCGKGTKHRTQFL